MVSSKVTFFYTKSTMLVKLTTANKEVLGVVEFVFHVEWPFFQS